MKVTAEALRSSLKGRGTCLGVYDSLGLVHVAGFVPAGLRHGEDTFRDEKHVILSVP